MLAGGAVEAREASAQEPAIEESFELFLGMLGQPHGERAVVDSAVQRLEIVAYDLIQRRGLGTTALIGVCALAGA